MPSTASIPAYEGLLYTVFQQLRQAADEREGLAIAFTSANPGEGVSHTIQALLSGLSRDGASRTLFVDARHLRHLKAAPEALGKLCRPLPGSQLFAFDDPSDFAGPHSWEGSWEYRRDVARHLRTLFDYVLIDCPALRESNDLLSLAPFVAGVILIVEAGRTRKDQVLHAEKQIAFARGKLIGHILNKRSYVVPEWLYRRL